MKSILLGFLVGLALALSSCNGMKVAHFPDTQLEDAIRNVTGMHLRKDTTIRQKHLKNIEELDVSGMNITDLDGIDSLPNLRSLSCYNNKLGCLNLQSNIHLQRLWCYSSAIDILILAPDIDLRTLSCSYNSILTLDVSVYQHLEVLDCSGNPLGTNGLNVSRNPLLRHLWCADLNLTSLDLSANVRLKNLNCKNNHLPTLDLSATKDLTFIDCDFNKLQRLDVSGQARLTKLYCAENRLTELDLSANPDLLVLCCQNNRITRLDISNNPHLQNVNAKGNPLTEIIVRNTNNLPKSRFIYDGNPIIRSISTEVSPGVDSAPAVDGEEREMLVEFLRKGGDLPGPLRQFDLAAVPLLEDVFISPSRLTEREYGDLVRRLGATKYGERESASCRLECAGPDVLPWIERDMKKADDPEVRRRLTQAHSRLQSWSSKMEILRKVLSAAYATHASTLWKQRIVAVPERDELDSRATLFVSMLPLNALKNCLANTAEGPRLGIILMILFKHNPGETFQLNEGQGGPGYTEWVEELHKFDAQDVLSACGRLWPVELESPVQNGAYFWTYRAEKAKGGRAENVIEISINRGGPVPRIVHFLVFREMTFDEKGFGPLVTWLGTKRDGTVWRTNPPLASKYLSTHEEVSGGNY